MAEVCLKMRSVTAFLGFVARIDGVDHPAAIFKLSGTGAFWWSWLEPSSGHLLRVDWPFTRSRRFLGITEFHGSYHRSGSRHRRIGTARIGNRRDTAIPDIQSWKSLRSVTVPLLEPFPCEMQAKPWNAVESPHILCSEDFDGADGVDLHGFICRRTRVDDLICRWRVAKQHWIVGDQDLRLVVLAEPIFPVHS
jgi:hypothetical protein